MIRCILIESFTDELAIVTFTRLDFSSDRRPGPSRSNIVLWARPDAYTVGQVYELALPTPVQS